MKPGVRDVIRAPGPKDAPERTEAFPEAKLTKEELREELSRHGFPPEVIARLEGARPAEYAGHRRCVLCGHYHVNRGEALSYCSVCGFCRHATIVSGTCHECGAFEPPFVELDAAHFDVHFLDEAGVVVKVER